MESLQRSAEDTDVCNEESKGKLVLGKDYFQAGKKLELASSSDCEV